MRPLFTLLLALTTLACAHAADAVSFVRVWPAWRDAAAFDRISEYFTGEENTGGQTIVRTTPDVRAGFYFLVRVANHAAALPDTSFALQLIRPDSPAPKTYTFPAALAAGQTVFDLGLTGPDFPNKEFHPVAWKLELRTADGAVLASQASFLWEKPEKK